MVEEIRARGSILGKCIPARYILAIMGSIGMAIVYGLKVNLSVTMVAMINYTAIRHEVKELNQSHESQVCQSPGNASSKVVEDGPFIWDERLQGTLLSCYFWGYLISQVPAAKIASAFSAKWVMFFSVAINVVCTLLTPLFTSLHFGGLITMRVLEGMGGGASFPAMHSMIASWSPPNERSVMSTITYVGTSFGTAVSILLSGVIAADLGWEAVFYIMGGLSLIWMILWAILIQDNPSKQPFISQEERDYINSHLGQKGNVVKKPPVPWKKVFTSIPFLAILISHVCSNWGWYMFLIEIPFYMNQVLKFDVSSNAMASALPYFPLLILSIILSKVLDSLKTKGKITTTFARKASTTLCTIVPGICLLILCYIGCQHTAAVIVMSIGIVAMGGMFSGFLSNHIDIAPNYAGTLVAITNSAATIPGIIVPIFVGFMTNKNATIDAWRVIFFVTIFLFIIEFLVFIIFGSGEEQSWNNPSKNRMDIQSEETPLKNTTTNTQ